MKPQVKSVLQDLVHLAEEERSLPEKARVGRAGDRRVQAINRMQERLKELTGRYINTHSETGLEEAKRWLRDGKHPREEHEHEAREQAARRTAYETATAKFDRLASEWYLALKKGDPAADKLAVLMEEEKERLVAAGISVF